MKLYFPDYVAGADTAGYNVLVKLFSKALRANITNVPHGADFRVYCNLPWHHAPEELKKSGKLGQDEYNNLIGRMNSSISPEEKVKPNKITETLPLMVYTMYESTRVPSSWIRFLNQHAAVVLVPSQWCKTMFECNGVTKPIFILSGCFDETTIQPVAKRSALGEYVFLWQGVALDRNGRKGADVAIRAFKELKKEGRLGADARLYMKYRPYPNIGMTFDRLALPSGVTYIQENLTRSQLMELYSEVDCCVNPTRGEGFGLIPLEQMAMGKPVIVTDWSMDYVNKSVCIPVQYKLEKSPITWNHRFFRVWKNGFGYNFGGLAHDVRLLPYLASKVCDGIFFKSATGENPKGWAMVKALANNLRWWLQTKTGFYFRADRKPVTLFQEHPGMDATVDIEDLKNKMEWCYNNRMKADLIGKKAADYTHSEWGIERMISDFDKIQPELKKILNTEKEF